MFLKKSVILFVMLAVTGCTTLKQDREIIPSYHLSDSTSTTLANLYQKLKPANTAEDTGFALLDNNKRAFLARTAAIELADEALDLQYYHWKNDEVGLLLMDRILRAADRGVKIRLLIDDSNSWDSRDKQIALGQINYHPNIEIKIYNPLGGSFSGAGMRSLALLGSFDRINHRMHNKIFIADNQLAIFGGRNIGNMYFGVGKKKNFRDMDVLAIGKQVNRISTAFDDYWNSEWSYRIDLIEDVDFSTSEFYQKRKEFNHRISQLNDFPYTIPNRLRLLEYLETLEDNLDWAALTIYSDPPRKDLKDKSTHAYHRIQNANISEKVASLTSSPYLIPTEKIIEQLKRKVDKGISIKVLTNSLSSNDVRLAQYGYTARRIALLEAGVELYEMRSDALDSEEYTAIKYRNSIIGLHAKVGVIDHKRVLIGSLNIDPRSTVINTEVVIVIESKALAHKVENALLRDISPRNSYQVYLDEDEKGNKNLRWRGEKNGEIIIYEKEPNANFMTSFGELLFGILPVDDQL